MLVPDTTPEQRTLLAVLYGALRDHGAWPVAGYADTVLDHDHGLELAATVEDVPPGLVWGDLRALNGELAATAAGLTLVEDARDDLELLVELVKAAVRLESDLVPSDPRSAPEAVLAASEFARAAADEGIAVDAAAVRRLNRIALVQGLPVTAVQESDEGEPDFDLHVGAWARGFRGVETVDDYIAALPEPAPRGGGLAAILETAAGTAVAVGAPYVFVVMPFAEQWSANVHDTINQACDRVATTVQGLRWERADEITETGRITDQILAAIERADVIVADATGANPNVMFELGYADALRKRIVLLNQSVDNAPFDIKDWRQITYDLADLAAAREQLVEFVIAALRAERGS